MKPTLRRTLSLMLAMVLALAALPLHAAAVEMKGYKEAYQYVNQTTPAGWEYRFDKTTVKTDPNGKITYSTNPNYVVGDTISKVTGAPASFVQLHAHNYEWTVNRDGHFYRCSCGAKTQFQEHIDPREAVDGCCTCGYRFMTNADLTVLWLRGMNLTTRFKPDTTDYEAKMLTYTSFPETKISAFSADAKAAVELPEDLTLKVGSKFEIKVTAEDGITTKTYTVTVVE